MWLVDLILGIVDTILNLQFGKRFGWGSFLWDLAAGVCWVITVIFFVANMAILGVIGIIASACFTAISCRRAWRDIRSKREKQKCEAEKMPFENL